MAYGSRCFSIHGFILLLFCSQILILTHAARSGTSDSIFLVPSPPESQGDEKGYRHLRDSSHCSYREGQAHSSKQMVVGRKDNDQHSTDQHQQVNTINPWKFKHEQLIEERKEERTGQRCLLGEDEPQVVQNEVTEGLKIFKNPIRRHYSIWRREHRNPYPDSTLKLMKDQIIMAKVYSSIAYSKKKRDLADKLMKHIKACQHAIGEANSDVELKHSALARAKDMGHVLSQAKDQLHNCATVAKKLRAMLQSLEEVIRAEKKKNNFLIQLATKLIPKPLHCLPLHLITDYFLHPRTSKEPIDKAKLEDSSLYHYAIFSDNVLATSVVVNSTVSNAKEPEKHVFHIVTDSLNLAAMKMWFIAHPHLAATIDVQNVDEFKWLKSYSPVIRQIESATRKSFYFAANHPHTFSVGDEHLKYRNPKYLSMLNHLRFYIPEIYPKLDKILFLDHDVVVQDDLTELWNTDMEGMVNGAVETCGESFHLFDAYLNFSDPKISGNFDPHDCGWAFGVNIFDLKEWRKHNLTGIYHYWQTMNKDQNLWKLGSLPAGLVVFHNLTLPIERFYHVLGLGYNPSIGLVEIEDASVIHYNGNYKPWLDLAIPKYKRFWTEYMDFDDAYVSACNIHP